MKLPCTLLATFVVLALTSGCVTGTREIGVAVPRAEAYTPNAQKGTVAIGPVTDDRVFENHPDDPSTPSVKGDINDLTPAGRSGYIGRQRNGFGKGMGDIELPDNGTVQGKVSGLLREGLMRRGYAITDASTADRVVTASIDKFWSWMTPGFFALTFEARISCHLTITQGGKETKLVVLGYGKNHGQIGKDGNWQEAWDIALADFLANLDQQLAAAGQ